MYVKILFALWTVTVLYMDTLFWHSNSWGGLWGSTTRKKLCSLWSTGSYKMISRHKHLPTDIQDEVEKDSKTAYEWNLFTHTSCVRNLV